MTVKPPVQSPPDQYVDLMQNARRRFDLIDALRAVDTDKFLKSETAAFHGRKIIEAVAFACLVATKNGLKSVPNDVGGQWNAEKIIRSLIKKQIGVFPSPSVIRVATEEEKLQDNAKITIEGIPERRISQSELIDTYRRLHQWLHELNPYVDSNRAAFLLQHEAELWNDLTRLHRFLERHFIAINNQGFYCTLRDTNDGTTKIVSLTKISEMAGKFGKR
jgi:hypothetical protein